MGESRDVTDRRDGPPRPCPDCRWMVGDLEFRVSVLWGAMDKIANSSYRWPRKIALEALERADNSERT